MKGCAEIQYYNHIVMCFIPTFKITLEGYISQIFLFRTSKPSPMCPSLVRMYTNKPFPHPRSTNDFLELVPSPSQRSNKYVAIATSSYTNFDASVHSGQIYKINKISYSLNCLVTNHDNV